MVAVKCQEQNCATKTREQLKKRLKRITENDFEFECTAKYLKLGRTTRNFGYCRSKVWLKKQKQKREQAEAVKNS